MSDLSRLLGDVYGMSTEADDEGRVDNTVSAADRVEPPVPDDQTGTTPDPTLPDWADEDVLDEAFASWVPGPPAEAPAAERSMLADLAAAPAPSPSSPPADSSPAPADAASEPAPVESGPSADDDLLAPRSGWLFDEDGPETTVSLDSLPRDGVLSPVEERTAVIDPFVGGSPEPVATARWRREDDDLLPQRRTTRRHR